MKPLVLLQTLAGVGLGFLLGSMVARHGRTPTAAPVTTLVTTVAEPPAPPHLAREAGGVDPAATAGQASRLRSPKARALLAGFDRRKPVESQLAVLQKILAASPLELAALANEMTSASRSDPGWWQARLAVMQRWVEVAPDEALAWAAATSKSPDRRNAIAEVLGVMATRDPSRALNEAMRLSNPMMKDNALSSVIGAIAQSDPSRALQLSESLPGQTRMNLSYRVFSVWADQDPQGAAAAVLGMKDKNASRQATWTLMNRWTQDDPEAALAWARGLNDSAARQGALQQFFSSLGQRDPESAIARISEFPKHQQSGYLSGVVGNWMQLDPEAATTWVLGRPNAIERQQLIAAAVGNLGWGASEQASTLVTQLTPGTARDDAMKQLINQWMWSDADAAVAFSKTLPAGEQLRLRDQVATSLAYRDPEKAIEYLKENPIDDPASGVWGTLASTMAQSKSAEKALAWANELPDELSRRRALPSVFSGMVQENPSEAARQAALVPDEATRLECLASVAGAWAGSGMEDALAWAKGLSGKERETAMGAVLGQGAPHQPRMAAEQFDSMMAGLPAGTRPADALVQAAGTIAAAFFAENEQAAAHWAASLPQDDARTAAMKSLADQWVQYDPAGASEWIGSLPGGKPRDAAVGQLVSKIAPSDPAAAFAWAGTVEDATARSNLLDSTFASWRKLDAPAARSAVETADWPDDEKTRWLDKLR